MIQTLDMEMEIKYSSQFSKWYQKCPPYIKTAFRETLELFVENPSDPSLRNHALKDKFAGYSSIDVTDDWRALFKEQVSGVKTVVIFHIIGTHEQLYGK